MRILQHNTTSPYLLEALHSTQSDQVLQAVRRWLDEPGNKSWLLVCDNYDSPLLDTRSPVVDSMAFNIRKYLPETISGAVIITTRSSKVKLGPIIHLERLGDINDCLRILELSSRRTDLRYGKPHLIDIKSREQLLSNIRHIGNGTCKNAGRATTCPCVGRFIPGASLNDLCGVYSTIASRINS